MGDTGSLDRCGYYHHCHEWGGSNYFFSLIKFIWGEKSKKTIWWNDHFYLGGWNFFFMGGFQFFVVVGGYNFCFSPNLFFLEEVQNICLVRGSIFSSLLAGWLVVRWLHSRCAMIKDNALWPLGVGKVASPFTKPPIFRRNRLTGSGNPSFESWVEVKTKYR